MYVALKATKFKGFIVLLILTLLHCTYFQLHDRFCFDSTQSKLSETRILCWVPTSAELRVAETTPIRKTWGQHCNKFLIMSTMNDQASDIVVALPVADRKESSWETSLLAWNYVYKHHLEDADWFLQTNTDS